MVGVFDAVQKSYVQMAKSKVAGGTDFVRSTLRAFVPASMQTVMMLDLLTYDAFPALATLEDRISCKYI